VGVGLAGVVTARPPIPAPRAESEPIDLMEAMRASGTLRGFGVGLAAATAGAVLVWLWRQRRAR
jgi:hypothetical protein